MFVILLIIILSELVYYSKYYTKSHLEMKQHHTAHMNSESLNIML